MVAEETGRPVRWTTELEATGWAVRTYSSTMKRSSRSRLSVSTSIPLAISTRMPRVLTEGQRSTRAESVSSAARDPPPPPPPPPPARGGGETTGLGDGEGRQASAERQASASRGRSAARVDPPPRRLLYSARPRSRPESKGVRRHDRSGTRRSPGEEGRQTQAARVSGPDPRCHRCPRLLASPRRRGRGVALGRSACPLGT